jgi:hypothetical protein
MSHDQQERQANGHAYYRVCRGLYDSLAPQNRYPLTRILRPRDVIRSVAVRRPSTKSLCSAIPAPKAGRRGPQQEVSRNKESHGLGPHSHRRAGSKGRGLGQPTGVPAQLILTEAVGTCGALEEPAFDELP